MPAITKIFTVFNDTAVDPDSPVDTALMTGFRDNDIHNREWIGASYYAGAVQDHNHDGVNSAMVEIGPNYLRNGSAESDGAGWTFTNYSGGSNAISSSQRQHGAKSFSFTSTVLANGGGWAESNEHVPCGGLQFLSVEGWRWASVANVSSKAELVWYDAAKAQISTSSVFSDTNTATTAALVQTGIQVPSTARYVRLRITGGVPGTGTATGTIYFDGWMIGRTYVVEALLGPAAVTQSKLKTTTASGSTTGASYSLTGGTHSWWTFSSTFTGGGSDQSLRLLGGGGDRGAGIIDCVEWAYGGAAPGGTTAYFDERYVQASPPYRHGPLFVFLALDAGGKIVCSQVAPDPPWAYHGPTDITPQFWRGDKAFRRVKKINGLSMHAAMRDPLALHALITGTAMVTEEEVEVTLAYKDSDMAVVPHPFVGNDLTGLRVVLLEPGTTLMERLAGFCDCGEAREVRNLILDGKLIIDNARLAIPNTPPGVMPVRARWKLT